MNIVRDTSRNAEVVSVPCLICGRMLRLADAWIDTDGPAFRAYYHAACLPKRCNRCHRPMTGTTAYDGACECGGLIEAAP